MSADRIGRTSRHDGGGSESNLVIANESGDESSSDSIPAPGRIPLDLFHFGLVPKMKRAPMCYPHSLSRRRINDIHFIEHVIINST